jgi:hypothetical protein
MRVDIQTLLLSWLIASPLAFAQSPFQVVPYVDGRRVTGAEVCLYKGRAGDATLDRFLQGDETHCYSADDVNQIPPGMWNFYVRHSDGFVSTHPFGVNAVANDARDARPILVDLVSAATLETSDANAHLQPGDYLALYISNDGLPNSLAAIRPIPRAAARVLAPTEMPLLLLLVRDGQIIWASHPLMLSSGQVLKAPSPDRPVARVLAFVDLDPTVLSADRRGLRDKTPPTVRLMKGSASIAASAFPLRPAPNFDGSLLTLENVAPGEYTVELGGEHWAIDRISVHVAESLTVASRPLIARPLSTIDVAWALNSNLALERAKATCEAFAIPLVTTLTLANCRLGFDRCAPRDRVQVERRELGDGQGQLSGDSTFTGLGAGDYYVELARGDTRARARATVQLAASAKVTVLLDPATVTGHITRAKKPIQATIEFPDGATAQSNTEGEYRAFLVRAPGHDTVFVTPCDTKKNYAEIPATPVGLPDQFDIDIPGNRLTVKTTDNATNEPLVGAEVTSRIETADHTIAAHALGTTDVSGTVTDEALSRVARFEVCARHEGYEPRCVGNVRILSDDQTLNVALDKSQKTLVRIIADRDIGAGKVFVAIDSVVISEAQIEQGTIRLDPATPQTAVLYVVATEYPLVRVPVVPVLVGEEPTLPLPNIAGVGVTITLSAEARHTGGPMGIEMGGIQIPYAVLWFHQALMHLPPLQLRKGQAVQLAPIDRSLPLTVLLWHWPQDVPAGLRVGNPFTNPAALRLMYRAPITGLQLVLTPPG